MFSKWIVLGLGMVIGAGTALAFHHEKDGEHVKVLNTRDIQEKLDGVDAKYTAVEVTIGPGESGLSHRHPGPGFGYVVEGEYELGIDDQPTVRVKAGEVFYEPTGCLHRVSKNPSAKGNTRLIAFVLHPRSANEIAVPVKDKNSGCYERAHTPLPERSELVRYTDLKNAVSGQPGVS